MAALAGLGGIATADLDVDTATAFDNAALGGTVQPGDRLGEALADGDFNGDGYRDIAIGIPSDGSVGGSVRTLLGGPDGPDPTTSTFFSQGTLFGAEFAEVGDGFGFSVASGDFNGDGYDDLAVGTPFEHLGDIADAGTVEIIFGSPEGLTPAGAQSLSQEGPLAGVPEPDDEFGFALASGDFDADGFADLAIGVWSESIAGAEGAGAVNVVHGSPDGITAEGNRFLNQRGPVFGVVEAGDGYGYALASGDFDDDGDDDLAIGVPFESLNGRDDVGIVNIVGGGPDGLTARGDFALTQRGPLKGIYEAGDTFGRALAVGNFDGDRFEDLAVGVPGEGRSGSPNAGAVNVVYGSQRSLQPGSDILLSQDGPVRGVAEPGDRFGWALAAGNIDNDRFHELVVGAPGESLRGRPEAGTVHVFEATQAGVIRGGNQFISQVGPVVGGPEPGDHFGEAVLVANVDGVDDANADLIVGSPDEGLPAGDNVGLVHIVFSS